MHDRRFPPLLLLALLAAPGLARAQDVHADDVEVIEPPAVKPTGGVKPDLAAAVRQIVERTNAFRKAEGRAPVGVNAKLTEAAQYFADYMARTDRYGHTADGTRPADRVTKYGYEYCLVAENIAYQYNSAGFQTEDLARGFFEGWKESPGHRKNMLDPGVTETGVAVARSDNTGYYYAVQLFGRPKSAALVFKVSNTTGEEARYRLGDRTFPLPPGLTRTHTRCRPAELTFRLPGAEGDTAAFEPGNGDRFAVVKGADGYRVKKE